MKKLLAFILALCMVLALCGCTASLDEETAAKLDDIEAQLDAIEAQLATEEAAPAEEAVEETEEAAEEKELPEPSEPLTIAYSCISYSLAPLTQALADNLKEAVEAKGWTFNMLAAEGDTELQGEQVSQLVSMQPDYLVIMPGDPTLAVDWLAEADEAGVPVIDLHISLGEGNTNALCYIGVDNNEIIQSIFDYMIDKNPDTAINLVEIAGVPVQADYIIRTNAYNELVAGNDNVTQLGDIAWAYSSRADAQTAMENFLSSYGDQINAVMGFTDNLTLGACAALDEAGRDDVQVYSLVYYEASYDAIAKGQMVTVFTSTGMMVDKTIECILMNEAGEEFDFDQHITCPIVDSTNVDEYPAEF